VRRVWQIGQSVRYSAVCFAALPFVFLDVASACTAAKTQSFKWQQTLRLRLVVSNRSARVGPIPELGLSENPVTLGSMQPENSERTAIVR
jgi:hypothetical protein